MGEPVLLGKSEQVRWNQEREKKMMTRPRYIWTMTVDKCYNLLLKKESSGRCCGMGWGWGRGLEGGMWMSFSTSQTLIFKIHRLMTRNTPHSQLITPYLELNNRQQVKGGSQLVILGSWEARRILVEPGWAYSQPGRVLSEGLRNLHPQMPWAF